MHAVVFPELAIMAPEILIPGEDIDLGRWAVIACDQFTSEPLYWTQVELDTAGVPSCAHMILPEVYLESTSADQLDHMISSINESINLYLSDGTLTALPSGFVLLSRATPYHPSRKGLVLAVDLDQYDFLPGSRTKIRATEGTVLSRIPPRVRIRRDARLELPHIMLLINDPDRIVIEPAYDYLASSGTTPLYDTDLMQGGGHVTGFFTETGSAVSRQITDALTLLLEKSVDGFLFAVGDGNHSLATAKAHWDSIRPSISSDEAVDHPARFALVEVVNIHDDGLAFEPIHRVAFGLCAEDFYAAAGTFFAGQGFHFLNEEDWNAQKEHFSVSAQIVPVISDGRCSYLVLTEPKHTLAVSSLQNVLDHLISVRPDVRLDYIHGEDAVRALSVSGNLGFLLPAISKSSFFETITAEGVFPRKTFSMGEAIEKRYYLEAKSIMPKE